MSSEPIQVYIRFRPLNSSELQDREFPMWELSSNQVSLRREYLNNLIEDKKVSASFNPSFSYDHVFSWEDENSKVYEVMAQKVVLSTLEGFNATIFAYGQTGSGKTYTMIGAPQVEASNFIKEKPKARQGRSPTPKSRTCKFRSTSAHSFRFEKVKKIPLQSNGIVALALGDLFKSASSYKTKHFFFKVSMIEIYNEHVFDLLKETEDLNNEILTVAESPDKEFYVKGLSEQVVTTIEEALEKLAKGEANRHYAATNLNHNSSRSHTIFRVSIRSLQVIPKRDHDADLEAEESFENITTESVLNFVDLAGSERTSCVQVLEEKQAKTSFFNTRHEQERLTSESKNINTSLFYLCQVINKLSELKMGIVKNDSHIPYRNSNLTKILRSSLGGNSRTCIICTATQAPTQFELTLSTLRFGNSARTLTNNVRANVKRETNSQLLLAYQQDIENLKKELESAKENGWTFFNQSNQLKFQLENKAQRLNEILMSFSFSGTFVVREEFESRFSVISSAIAGDLVIVNSRVAQYNERVLSNSSLKFDSNCLMAGKRLAVLKNEIRRLIEKIEICNKNVSGLKITKMNVFFI
jgi:centromeric protein E